MDPDVQKQLNKVKNKTHLLGIDESGTGALAGPFYLSAAVAELDWNVPGVRDSKKTDHEERRRLVELMEEDARLLHAEAPAVVEDIVRKGQAEAYRGAFHIAVKSVLEYSNIEKKKIVVVMDGSPNKNLAKILNRLGLLDILFVVKADAKVPHVSAASIFAKFNRDCEMNLLDKKFPGYYFSTHAGYRTKLHREKIAELGLVPGVHRT